MSNYTKHVLKELGETAVCAGGGPFSFSAIHFLASGLYCPRYFGDGDVLTCGFCSNLEMLLSRLVSGDGSIHLQSIVGAYDLDA